MSEQETEDESEIEPETEVEQEDESLRDHRSFKKLEKQIGEHFGRDTSKGGRPTVIERQFRTFFHEITNFNILKEFQEEQKQGPKPKNRKQSDKNGGGPFEQFFGSNFFSMMGDNNIKETIKKFGPIITVIVGEWIAEESIDDWPKLLHTIFDILRLVLVLVQTLIGFFGGIPEFIADLGAGFDANVQKVTKKRREKTAKIKKKIEKGDTVGASVDIVMEAFSALGKIPSF